MTPLGAALLLAAAAFADELGAGASQKLSEKGDSYRSVYEFQTFSRDRLELSFSYKKSDYEKYDAEWGYSAKEIDALKDWQKKAKQEAFNNAVKKGHSQAQLDAAVAAVGAQYKKKLAEYLAMRGFIVSPDNTVRVNMPGVVAKNVAAMRPLALDLDAEARKRKYDALDTVAAAAAMLQTALFYRQPPLVMDGRNTGGVLPPVVALVKGWGDCDTKTAALGALLKNYSSARMVGIAVPGHYLIGVLGSPNKGDVFVDYEGQRYVLIEPAGPGPLAPGSVSPETAAMLGANEFRIEPFN